MDMNTVRSAFVVELVTPKKLNLRGLWFGPAKPKRVIVWVHGLGGSAFSMRHVIDAIVDKNTAVLTFNNRGSERVVDMRRKDGMKGKTIQAGAAHETFVDSVDDLQGAIKFAKRAGVQKVYLAGHSTGCQKSIFWASKNNGGKGVQGIILVAPVSDYAGAMKKYGMRKLGHATQFALRLIKQGKKHELLPRSIWSEELNDAQRFVSLYTPDSVEEIFSYAQPRKVPKILMSVKVPILTLWAAKDEYADRKSTEIEKWFKNSTVGQDSKFATVPNVGHGFRGGEKIVARTVRRWIEGSKKA